MRAHVLIVAIGSALGLAVLMALKKLALKAQYSSDVSNPRTIGSPDGQQKKIDPSGVDIGKDEQLKRTYQRDHVFDDGSRRVHVDFDHGANCHTVRQNCGLRSIDALARYPRPPDGLLPV